METMLPKSITRKLTRLLVIIDITGFVLLVVAEKKEFMGRGRKILSISDQKTLKLTNTSGHKLL